MTPHAFRAMTLREVQWRIDGIVQEQNRQLELIAQLACWVLGPFGSKPLRVSDLIRRKDVGVEAEPRTIEQWREWAGEADAALIAAQAKN